MDTKLRTRGDVSISLFNSNGHNAYGYKEDSLRFEWIKRLPFASFSYNEFIERSRELIDLTRKHQRLEPLVEILGFSDPQDCLKVYSLSGGQDDETAHSILNKRNSYSFEDFTREDYEKNTEPTLALKSEGKEHFMICLTASAGCRTFSIGGGPYLSSFISRNPKKRLEFYGQCLNAELFEAIVKKYHKPGLNHSLSHPYVDNPLSYLQSII